ncbi:MAG: helicase-associated domain-containing protein [Candidatus Nanopelagicales bacterium]
MRSLADDLRQRSEEQLAALFQARPDLLHPVCRDITTLATRACGEGSVAHALARFNQFELLVAQAAAVWEQPVDVAAISRALGRPARAPLLRMHKEALAWGPPAELRVVGEVGKVLLNTRAGLAMAPLDPLIRQYASEPEQVRELLAQAPPGAREALETLLPPPRLGMLARARRRVSRTGHTTAMEWLLAHHLIVPVGPERVAMPAEIAAVLASADPAAHPRERREGIEIASATPPLPSGKPLRPAEVDAAALSPAVRFVRRVEQLILLWADEPPPALQAGGVGVRARNNAARTLGATPAEVALAIRVATASGLVGPTWEGRAVWLPTVAFDAWLAGSAAQRWLSLAEGWLESSGTEPGQAGGSESKSGAVPADIADIRTAVLQMLAASPAPPTPAEAQEQLHWLAPLRWSARQAPLGEQVIAEAGDIGMVALRALTTAGRALLAHRLSRTTALPPWGTGPAAAAGAAGDPEVNLVVGNWFPAPVDQLVVQADLTAIVPGPPTPELARLLRASARCEAFDLASTYRFSRESVTGALAGGMTASGLRDELQRRIARPLPAALGVLISDAARTYGTLRAGSAASYLRSDDPALLAGLLGHPRLGDLGLTQLAPTVLVSAADPDELVLALRAAGLSVAPEASGGELLQAPPRRAKPITASGSPSRSGADPAMIAAAVAALRHGAGTQHYRAAPPIIPDLPPAQLVATLREGIGARLWISYDTGHGLVEPQLVQPIAVVGGSLRALDVARRQTSKYPLARIAGAIAE